MGVLETWDLAVGYRTGKSETVVAGDLNLSLRRGNLVSLLGANGIGKSTLLRTLSGVQPVLNGEVKINGISISQYSARQLSKLVSIVTTEKTSVGGLTVRELVGLGRQPHTGLMGRLHKEDKLIVDDSLTAVGITCKANCYMSELSDGERQKAMIAKALAQETPLIILDEPTAFLDVASRIEILRLLHDLARKERKAILMSSHDVSQALTLSDRLWLLYPNHRILDIVPEDAVLNNCLQSLFSQKSVAFNVHTGDYTSGERGKTPISIKSKSDILLYWCKNAVQRNGFRCEDGADLLVDVISSKEYRICRNGNIEVVNSMEQLLDKIGYF